MNECEFQKCPHWNCAESLASLPMILAWGKYFTQKIHTIKCIKTGDKLSLYPTKSICKLQKYYLYYITFIYLWASENILFLEKSFFFSLRSSIFVCTIWTLHFISLKCAIVHYKCFTNISTKRTYTTYHLLGKIAEYFEIGSLFRGILVDFFQWCFFMRLGNSISYYLFEKFVYFIYLSLNWYIYLRFVRFYLALFHI